ncbi:histidine phosphatase family protein [Candidatus Pacearchaeota archaeon]|nr:histidine phosphatase family protein [Candidatus Pacearchaeota archaeon]
MRLIITRHGETKENKAGIIQGHSPGVLSDLGKEQAGKLAKRLKDEKIDLIISSDLDRALDTAKAVIKFHEGVDLVLDERLRERFFGGLEGKKIKELGVPTGMPLMESLKFLKDEDFENNEEILARAKDLVKDILEKDKGNVLLVGHGGICKFVIAVLGEKNIEDLKGVWLENTSISIFEGESKEMRLRLLNCVEHLDEN